MKFGMPTLIELNTIDECVRLCKKLHLQFIEINMNLPQYQTDTIDIEKLTFLRAHEGIYFTIHLDENLNVCDFNRLVADAYQTTVLQTIYIAKQIQAPILNMHLSQGVYFTLPGQKEYLFDRFRDHYFASLLAFREIVHQEIYHSDLRICIENTSGYRAFTKEGITLLLESEVFGLTYDTGHDFCIGGMDEEFILSHVARLFHMHLHDADERQSHLPLGDGKINILEKIRMAKHTHCSVVLETKTVEGLVKSVHQLNNYLW